MQSNQVQDAAFADALARAKEIAARINVNITGSVSSPAGKRPFSEAETGVEEPALKKPATSVESAFDAQLKAIAEQQGTTTSAAQTAQLVAARINQQLGAAPAQMTALPTAGFPITTGPVHTIEHVIPDKMVGLVIGKEGKQITKLQADTGCKIQIAPDGVGLITRACTMTGTPEAIQAARIFMQDIIDNAKSATAPMEPVVQMDGAIIEDMMVSGDKVGLVIGKSGDTIKKIQEETGVKMVMIQENNAPTMQEKPLRFTGPKDRVERAKAMVVELLKEKGGFPTPQPTQDNTIEVVPVPRDLVGIIIGKGGETIRKIGADFEVRLQFNPDDGLSPDRVCAIMKTGPNSDVQSAAKDVHMRVEAAKMDMSKRQMGQGQSPSQQQQQAPQQGQQDHMGGGGGPRQETIMAVPADKCGFVIGKGGANINEIKAISGAHVELQRNIQPPEGQKLFMINGTGEQIGRAMELIREKAGMHGGQDLGMGGPGGPGGHNQMQNSPFPPHLQQHNQQPNQPGFGQGWGDQNYNPQQMGQPQRNSPKPDNTIQYPNFYQQQQQQQFGQQNPMNQFNGTQQPQQNLQQQQMPGQQIQPQNPQQQPQQQPQPQQQVRPNLTSQPMINRETGQPDYSLQWYEYYMGMSLFNEANRILQQAPHVALAIQAKQQGGPPPMQVPMQQQQPGQHHQQPGQQQPHY